MTPKFPCTSPIRLNLRGAPDVRCRRCNGCKNAKRWGYFVKSGVEMAQADSTYMVTMTFNAAARKWIARAATGYRDGRATQQARLHRAARKLWSRYLKRLRKARIKVRYLVVVEDHKNGWPHLHGLLFVRQSDAIVTAREIGRHWRYGFTVVKPVVSDGAIRYVTKYILKTGAKAVCSQRYGLRPEALISAVEKDAYGQRTTEGGKEWELEALRGHPSMDREPPQGQAPGGALLLFLEAEDQAQPSDHRSASGEARSDGLSEPP